MHLDLIIPGLIRPISTWMSDFDWQPRADALANLLGSASHKKIVADKNPILNAAQLLGWAGNNFPAAIFRARSQEITPPPESGWICADPVHLQTDANSAVIMDGGSCDLRHDEANELIMALERQLGGNGWHFHIGTKDDWYLQTPKGEEPDNVWRDEIIGRDLLQYPESTARSQVWARFLTEIQMVLFQHPVNQSRLDRGLPIINSLWCWGRGGIDISLNPSDVNLVMSGDSLIRGVAGVAGVSCMMPDPVALMNYGSARSLIVIDSLRKPAAYDDIQSWESALRMMNDEWFSLLNEQVENGTVTEIRLLTDCHEWIIRRKKLFGRWRKARSLVDILGQS